MPSLAVIGGLLLGGDVAANVIAAVSLMLGLAMLAALIRGQKRVAAALSRWFGVKISMGQLPLMKPNRFDAWCERVGVDHGNAKRSDGEQPLKPLKIEYAHKWGPIRWSGPERRGRRQ